MYTVGLETDTRAYFTGITILISLPTGTKIFNWLSTYLGNPPLLHLKTTSAFFGLLFLLMFTIGGSTGIILGNAAVDLGLHDTYYVVAHFHFVLSLGAVIAIFSGIIFIGEKIVGSKILLPSSSSTLSLYHLVSTFIGILLTFSPMHFLGFNLMPRRIPDFPDYFKFSLNGDASGRSEHKTLKNLMKSSSPWLLPGAPRRPSRHSYLSCLNHLAAAFLIKGIEIVIK